jgi:hypothetical protein
MHKIDYIFKETVACDCVIDLSNKKNYTSIVVFLHSTEWEKTISRYCPYNINVALIISG